jgi:hypothetical protein
MNHSSSTILMLFAAALTVTSDGASAQMSMMRQPMPMGQRVDLNSKLLATEDQWINSIVDHWSSSQRRSWRLLDRRFCGWASHLVWMRKTAGRPSDEVVAPASPVPPACAVDSFVPPEQSVAESMDYFRQLLPGIDWNAWANIDPAFRSLAEWEMSAEHAKAQMSKALKTWWDLNGEKVQACLITQAGEASTSSAGIVQASTARSSTSLPSQRYAQIERRARSERSTVDRMTAPEPIKQEAREQVSDAATVDKYMADIDRRKPQ